MTYLFFKVVRREAERFLFLMPNITNSSLFKYLIYFTGYLIT